MSYNVAPQLYNTSNLPIIPDIATHLNPYVSYNVVPQFYHTPPYLHAIPEVSYHRLTPRDRFLVIASDGLWDMMTPSQVQKNACKLCIVSECSLLLFNTQLLI